MKLKYLLVEHSFTGVPTGLCRDYLETSRRAFCMFSFIRINSDLLGLAALKAAFISYFT